MVPVYLFYSMFGFQRVGDLAWALGDMRGRGILAGCTAGRTTLMGEGLQHDDGQSPLLASTNPAALVYDASFAYEVAVIMEDGGHRDARGRTPRTASGTSRSTTRPTPCRRCPRAPTGEAVRQGIIDGIYRFAAGARGRRARTISGPRCASRGHVERRHRGAAHPGRALRRRRRHLGRHLVDEPAHRRARGRSGGTACTPRSRARPSSPRRWAPGPTPWSPSPTTCARVPDQVARFVDRPYISLGTDGFGRSDAREALRSLLRGRRAQPRRRRAAAAGPGRGG